MSLDIDIQCFEPRQRYTNNDTINGIVVLTVRNDVEIDSLLVCCQCTSETNISVGTQNFKSFEEHYRKEQVKPLGTLFTVGRYEFPFSFQLPASPLLPETYSSGHVALNGSRDNKSGNGNVVWEIKGSVPRFKLFDISLESSLQFWFIPTLQKEIYNPRSEFPFPPVPVKVGPRFWRKDKAPNIYFTLSMLDTGIQQDANKCGIRLNMYSDVERLLFVKTLRLSLEATTVFTAKNHQFKDTSNTEILNLSPNLPLSLDPINLGMCLDTEDFGLPVLFYGSLQTKLISLGYSLIVEAVIGSFADPKLAKYRQVKLPVVVKPLQQYVGAGAGTIGVRGANMTPPPIQPPGGLNIITSHSPHFRAKDYAHHDADELVTPMTPSDSNNASSLPSSSLQSADLRALGSAFNAEISSSPITPPSSTSHKQNPHAPHVVPREIVNFSRHPSYSLAGTHDSTPHSSILNRRFSSSSLDQLWEPEYDDDIAALVFRDAERSLGPKIRSVKS